MRKLHPSTGVARGQGARLPHRNASNDKFVPSRPFFGLHLIVGTNSALRSVKTFFCSGHSLWKFWVEPPPPKSEIKLQLHFGLPQSKTLNRTVKTFLWFGAPPIINPGYAYAPQGYQIIGNNSTDAIETSYRP